MSEARPEKHDDRKHDSQNGVMLPNMVGVFYDRCGPLQRLLAGGPSVLPRWHPSGAAAAQNSRVSFG